MSDEQNLEEKLKAALSEGNIGKPIVIGPGMKWESRSAAPIETPEMIEKRHAEMRQMIREEIEAWWKQPRFPPPVGPITVTAKPDGKGCVPLQFGLSEEKVRQIVAEEFAKPRRVRAAMTSSTIELDEESLTPRKNALRDITEELDNISEIERVRSNKAVDAAVQKEREFAKTNLVDAIRHAMDAERERCLAICREVDADNLWELVSKIEQKPFVDAKMAETYGKPTSFKADLQAFISKRLATALRDREPELMELVTAVADHKTPVDDTTVQHILKDVDGEICHLIREMATAAMKDSHDEWLKLCREALRAAVLRLAERFK
jgi:hypothetical protein